MRDKYLFPLTSYLNKTKVYGTYVIGLILAVLVEDNAGWHRSKKATIPEGIKIEFLPAYSPELQPAERLWKLVDEPLVNQHFETIDEIENILVKRCCTLIQMKDEIRNLTLLSLASR
ncbi:MAG: transposase [Xenococcaceae cyanobacterium MO_207.B15]|nr:transposase [Xenococcaceae cyanobacterium MO_207.B15]